jgi:hypothetical protein
MTSRTISALVMATFFIPSTILSQTTPPTLTFTTPTGIQRGTSGTFVVEGTDLAGATGVVFSEPGLTGKILSVCEVPESKLALEPKLVRSVRSYFDDPPKVQATIQISSESWMSPGTHQFRVITPHGSSTPGRLVVSLYPELEEREPNDAAEDSQELNLPVTVGGVISTPGDTDQFSFHAEAGQEIVCLVSAGGLGSSMDPLVELLDPEGKRVASNLEERDRNALGVRITSDGRYTLRVRDYQENGSIRHFYRLTVGQLPFLKGRYPLGLKAGTTRDFTVRGYNLGEVKSASPEPFGLAEGKAMDIGALGVQTPSGEAVNMLPLAIGLYEEFDETGKNNTLQTAQAVRYPATINARISLDSAGKAAPDYYSFLAKKGQKLVLETAANRLGSPLDSVIEVTDATGKIVPRLTARAVWKTQLTLRDRESASPGLRLFQPTGLELHDYMVAGNDLMRIVRLTSAPGADEDIIFESFGGKRLGFEDTTPEAHPIDGLIYKVELHPADAEFPPNGMPVFRFGMRNDDGGPGYGKDSRVTFTAPSDGTYYVKVADVRGLGGDDFAYRLTIREPVPDYLVTATPTNPNIPEGSASAIQVSTFRAEGFEGPINVEFDGLPEGIQGTHGTIQPGEDSVTLILSHKPGTKLPDNWARYRILARAQIGSRVAERVANGGDYLKLISLMPKPDVKVIVKTPQVSLPAAGEAKITLAVQRDNGFKGRVLFRLEDLPFGVRPVNVGLNGIMIAENETERTFTLDSRPWVKAGVKPIYAIGLVEALVQTEHPSVPIALQIVGAERAAK